MFLRITSDEEKIMAKQRRKQLILGMFLFLVISSIGFFLFATLFGLQFAVFMFAMLAFVILIGNLLR